jgi:2-methylcitrate dehydratase PrpD
VTIELTGGERDEERVDLPVGSIASPHATAALEAKVLASLERTVGEDRARRALAAGLAAETLDLGELVRELSV